MKAPHKKSSLREAFENIAKIGVLVADSVAALQPSCAESWKAW